MARAPAVCVLKKLGASRRLTSPGLVNVGILRLNIVNISAPAFVGVPPRRPRSARRAKYHTAKCRGVPAGVIGIPAARLIIEPSAPAVVSVSK